MRRLALLALCLGWAAGVARAETIELPAIGLSIERPESWQQRSSEVDVQSLRTIPLRNEEDRRLMLAQREGLPLVVLVKDPGMQSEAIPAIRVAARQARSRDLGGVLRGAAALMARNYPDARIETGPSGTERFGRGGSNIRVAYTAGSGDAAVPVQMDLWAVIRGELLYIVTVSMPRDEPPATRAEAEAILNSISISTPTR